MKPSYNTLIKHYCLQFHILRAKSNTMRTSELRTEYMCSEQEIMN